MNELSLLLLGVLRAGPAHGYSIIATLRERSDGVFDYPEGTIYPALHRLEKAGHVDSTPATVDGRRRRIYTLTPAGRSALAEQQAAWLTAVQATRAVLA